MFEDTAFDVIDKFIISDKEEETGKDLVTVLAFDNNYMKDKQLYDANEIANYGYTFPRKSIVDLITQLDQRLKKLSANTETQICPKAIFIDFDLSYPTGANGELSNGDSKLLKALSIKRCYKTLLPIITTHHYIKESKDKENPIHNAIQKRIKYDDILFVSPYFHFGSDDVTRRYEPIKTIGGENYISAPIALWQLIKYGKVYLKQAETFPDHAKQVSKENPITRPKGESLNVNANMIWIKNYNKDKSNDCLQQSYWQQLHKYSLSTECDKNLNNITHERINNRVLLIGGTDKENPNYKPSSGDYHNVLKIINTESMSGVDLHANTLMTLLHLAKNNQANPVMQQVNIWLAISIIFISFFLIDLLIAMLLQRYAVSSEQTHIILSFTINTVVLLGISILFIKAEQLQWFNWIGVLLLFELIEGIILTRRYLPILLNLLLIKLFVIIKHQLPALFKWLYAKVIAITKIIATKIQEKNQ